MSTEAKQNTDRELWREREGDYYADSIHVTIHGDFGINVAGLVIVKSLQAWHSQDRENADLRAHLAQLQQEKDTLQKTQAFFVSNDTRHGHEFNLAERLVAAEAALIQCQQERGADGFVMNCLIAPRDASDVLFEMGSNGRFVAVRLDGYAVVPREQWDSLEAKVAASEQDRARLRATVERCRALVAIFEKHRLVNEEQAEKAVALSYLDCKLRLTDAIDGALVGDPPPPEPEKET